MTVRLHLSTLRAVNPSAQESRLFRNKLRGSAPTRPLHLRAAVNPYDVLPFVMLAILLGFWIMACFAAARPRQFVAFTMRRSLRKWVGKPTSMRREVRLVRIQAIAAVFLLGLFFVAVLLSALR